MSEKDTFPTIGRRRLNRRVFDMKPNDFAYVVPWAIKVDIDGRCWVDKAFRAHHHPGGTVDCLVVRKHSGFEIDISGTDNVWISDSTRFDKDGRYGPVVEIIDNNDESRNK